MNRSSARINKGQPQTLPPVGLAMMLWLIASPWTTSQLHAERFERPSNRQSSLDERRQLDSGTRSGSALRTVVDGRHDSQPKQAAQAIPRRGSDSIKAVNYESEGDDVVTESIPLSPRRGNRTQALNPAAPPSAARALTSVAGSLGVVLGMFCLLVWIVKRSSPKSAAILPKEVVEVFGRTALSQRQYAHVVRFGSKLLLVSVSPSGVESLAEISDMAEVERLVGLCQESQPGSVTQTFRQIFSQLSNEPARPGFVESTSRVRDGVRSSGRAAQGVEHA